MAALRTIAFITMLLYFIIFLLNVYQRDISAALGWFNALLCNLTTYAVLSKQKKSN